MQNNTSPLISTFSRAMIFDFIFYIAGWLESFDKSKSSWAKRHASWLCHVSCHVSSPSRLAGILITAASYSITIWVGKHNLFPAFHSFYESWNDVSNLCSGPKRSPVRLDASVWFILAVFRRSYEKNCLKSQHQTSQRWGFWEPLCTSAHTYNLSYVGKLI